VRTTNTAGQSNSQSSNNPVDVTDQGESKLFWQIGRWVSGAVALCFVAQAVACGGGSSGNSSQSQPLCHSSLPAEIPLSQAPSAGMRALSSDSEESTGTVSEAIVNGPFAFDPRRHEHRTVVRIETLRNGVVQATASGFVVGAHFVLTAAHTFDRAFGNYDAIRVVAIDGQGNDVQIPVVETLINPFWQQIPANSNYPMAQASEDFAYLAVPIDFAVIGIAPLTMRLGFRPQHDCNECPVNAVTAMGWGAGRLRGAEVIPWNSDRVIQSTGVLEFQQATESGDSGGPILFFDARAGQQYAVGIIVASARTAGRSYGAVLSQEAIGSLARLAVNFEADSYGYRYPQPSEQLPNGAPNPASTNYPTSVPGAGPSTTTNGTHGFFAIEYPTPAPRNFMQFNHPGGCG
jgi:hypothetical protein